MFYSNRAAPAARLTDWGRAMHICVSNQTTIGSDNGLLPGRHQAITWANAGILLFGSLGAKFNKKHLNMLSEKWRPFCLCLNVLTLPNKVMHKHYAHGCVMLCFIVVMSYILIGWINLFTYDLQKHFTGTCWPQCQLVAIRNMSKINFHLPKITHSKVQTMSINFYMCCTMISDFH